MSLHNATHPAVYPLSAKRVRVMWIMTAAAAVVVVGTWHGSPRAWGFAAATVLLAILVDRIANAGWRTAALTFGFIVLRSAFFRRADPFTLIGAQIIGTALLAVGVTILVHHHLVARRAQP